MKTTQTSLNLATAIMVVACAGCASIFTRGDRSIPVSSNPTSATVIVYDKDTNVVANSITPTKIKLKKGAEYFKGADYRLVVEKAGYQAQEFEIKHDINGWYFGNFIIGGALGLLIVDPLTDGMWVLKPGQIEAELTPTASGTSLDHPKLLIVSRDQLSPNQQARLIPLGPAND